MDRGCLLAIAIVILGFALLHYWPFNNRVYYGARLSPSGYSVIERVGQTGLAVDSPGFHIFSMRMIARLKSGRILDFHWRTDSEIDVIVTPGAIVDHSLDVETRIKRNYIQSPKPN